MSGIVPQLRIGLMAHMSLSELLREEEGGAGECGPGKWNVSCSFVSVGNDIIQRYAPRW